MEIDNPLFSYKLQKRLTETINNHRYSKQVGHETVRYPLAGLVGTKEDAESTDLHNSLLEDPSTRLNILNDNVRAWLNGTVVIPGDGDPTHEPKIPDTRTPDTYSIGSRFKLCLNAPNYTVFPNTTSAKAWNEARWYDPNTILNTVYPIESPHNAIHLAVGGSYQFAEYNADPIRGANGDMGDNETAAFDPIFFFHHCFIHYVFWGWQKKMGLAAAGSLDIISSTSPWPETFTEHRVAWSALGDHSEHANSLHPFKYTSYDVTDITPLGFSYGKGSLVYLFQLPLKQDAPDPLSEVAILLKSHQIDRADYPGSFGVRTFATVDSDGTTPAKKVEIGRDAILSRWNVANCANCSNKLSVQSLVPVNQALSDELKNWADVAEIKYESTIQTHFDIALTAAVGGGLSPITEPL
jgi:tyrosinase